MERFLGLDPGIAIIREKAPIEELEYGFVMECLQKYNNPRVKLHDLLQMKALIDVIENFKSQHKVME